MSKSQAAEISVPPCQHATSSGRLASIDLHHARDNTQLCLISVRTTRLSRLQTRHIHVHLGLEPGHTYIDEEREAVSPDVN